ncbi:bifunctional ADP-dependent NAD(P)H-hydrate dehydratase/NAD(P)H-hydrate epimerase [Helicobacter pylori]|uniref:NAD(P)H-hydrate epimerase n=1 Tax=Helicobacter pylori (strain B8) TaxID=693745 RepID=D7FFY4_HELP3|nr:bifunctional ADP-dependent NAD(P)H-hydrate dehydratase/NAD(P)H-hydrate epimerase [Helicobacter pylori]AVG74278.1 bifunctional ADP-dependent (S)-NAD(P)H-hydrate dehydratase/NAD(P)H-hydrate epimerase [Helicobacter pylori]AVG80322.1 bifunctional ADP-dependent NAD(P)H-hydrate dehydratase/NAD(P)H-hydrate epimerase [Helicobacter pylori]AVG81805.1 bifunctional ADP-dependent NAD(P)H-hydrate dehydratase/NAD(P)H-hydrate epimerase [Helicobacter pylori]AVG83172.1 bifunctional ADP-dependent NAD(P)H-hydra
MLSVYEKVNALDKRAIEELFLSEDILMENAAMALERAVLQNASLGAKVIILCGSGDNGGDGYALARRLIGRFRVLVFEMKRAKSPMCQLQKERAKKAGVVIKTYEENALNQNLECDVLIDCVVGSNFKGELEPFLNFESLSQKARFKIACDIPSGIDSKGRVDKGAFRADTTISMGAIKSCLLSDKAKDYVGELKVGHLGVFNQIYEIPTDTFLLEKSDLKLPLRDKKNAHKGDYGHAHVLLGKHSGAGLLSALSALSFGSGVVSVQALECEITSNNKPLELVFCENFPNFLSAFALGMGLENIPKDFNKWLELAPCVLDAGVFYHKEVLQALEKEVILTPHPKEFLSLLKLVGINISMLELLDNKLEIARDFSQKYPKVVLLLKGANTLIAHQGRTFINNLGSVALAKAGSGDVLAGLILSLLSQNYTPLDAAINASLAHALAGLEFKNNYALTPLDLIEKIKRL